MAEHDWAVPRAARRVALYLIDMPSLSPKAHILAAVLSWTVVWWVCEPIPLAMTALMSSVLCVIFGVSDARAVFAPYADPIIYLFLGSFMLAEAMAIHGLDKRFAYGIMSLKFVGNSTGRILLAFGFICAFLSMWISNTAATAMMFPIALGHRLCAGGHPGKADRKEGRPAETALRHRNDADGGLRSVGRRHRHARRHSAEPDRHRHDREVLRREDRFLPMDELRDSAC